MPAQVEGVLPMSDGGANMFQGGMGGLAANYATAYRSALQMNQANYNNILAGYHTTLSNQVSAQNAIGRGYTDLSNKVLGDLHNVGVTARQNNADAYAQASGSMAQQMIDRGLGNTTVQQSMQRGLEYDRTKANNSVDENVGNLLANYRSTLGQAGLAFRERASGANTNLQQDQLHWMNSVNAPYPNASAYAQLAMMYGANDQADKNRKAMMAMSGGLGGGGGGGYGAQQAYGTGWQPPAWTRGDGLGGYGGGSLSGLTNDQWNASIGNSTGMNVATGLFGGGGGSAGGGGEDWGMGSAPTWSDAYNPFAGGGYGQGMGGDQLAQYQADPMF